MRVLIEDHDHVGENQDPVCIQKDAERIRKILETGRGSMEELKVFDCIGRHIVDLSQCLRKAFQLNRVPITSEDRLTLAEQIIGQALFILSILEPSLIDFRAANVPVHVAEAASQLRQLMRNLRELTEQKDEQRRQVLGRLIR